MMRIFTLSFLLFAALSVQSGWGAGLLRLNPANPRYFVDESGKPVYLNGHSGCPFNHQGGWETSTPLFDDPHENLCRAWVWENSRWNDGKAGNNYDKNGLIAPLPFLRTGPGLALDGQPKFDLTQFDQSFFDRLRAGIMEAGKRGVYVQLMLFQGWSVYNRNGVNSWFGHYFNRHNNINGIDGDLDGNDDGSEVFTLANPSVTEFQKTYVRKMIDTLNDLDNVIWEVANEAPAHSLQWHYQMIGLIKSYEAAKYPKQHVVGMSGMISADNAALTSSPADWIAPSALTFESVSDPYSSELPVMNTDKVVILDSDHIGLTIWKDMTFSLQWIWKAFTRGYNPLYQEMNHNAAAQVGGFTNSYAKRMALATMTPSTSACSTAYCLVNSGKEYLVFAPNGGNFTVTLDAATYSYEWFDPSTGAVVDSGILTAAAGKRSFRAAFTGDAVLYLVAMEVAE
jgi:hypothetical protein